MESFRELFRISGIYGSFTFFSFFIAFGLLLSLSILIKNHYKYLYSIIAVIAPLIIGSLGTYLGYRDVDIDVATTPGFYTQEAIESGYEVSWSSFELGWKLMIPLLLIFVITYLYKYRKNAYGKN